MSGAAARATLLAIEDLVVEYPGRRGALQALRGVSLALAAGEALGLVGESGCGKSTLGLAVMGLTAPAGRVAAGRIRFEGRELRGLSERDWRRLRGERVSIILQDPTTALDPVQRIGDQVAEMFRWHRPAMRGREVRRAVVAMLGQVGIAEPERRRRSFPHELSGGMRQRVAIACALAMNPALLIADEPTTALDTTVQAQVLGLIRRLRAEHGTAMLLISHDLGVVADTCDRVAVMYAGRVVETGAADVVLTRPLHPYTAGLLACRPDPDRLDVALQPIPGMVPDPADLPSGCAFRTRCSLAIAACAGDVPDLREVRPGHHAACIRSA